MSDERHGDPPCGTTGRDLPPELTMKPTDWRHSMRAEIRRLQLEVARLTKERDDKYVFLAGLERRLDEWRADGAAAETENDRLKAEVARLTAERDEAREGQRPAAIVLVGYGVETRVHGFEVYDEAHAWLTASSNNFRTITDTQDGAIWVWHPAKSTKEVSP